MPDTDLVSITVTVTDISDRLVMGLDRNHFEIYEDKVKQEISFFSLTTRRSTWDRLRRVGEHMKASSTAPETRSRPSSRPRTATTTSSWSGSISAPTCWPSSPTARRWLTNSLWLTLAVKRRSTTRRIWGSRRQQGRHNRNAILLISDGQDNSSRYTYGELRKLLKEAGVQIYCIGIVEMGGGAGGTLDMGGRRFWRR